MPLLRIPKSFIRRDIQTLIRTFPSETITITRATPGTWNDLGDHTPGAAIIYLGEALVIPAGGTVNVLGLGQVEDKNPRLLISGSWPIEQGDEVILAHRRYTVAFEPDHWQSFLHITLQPTDATVTP